MDEASLARENHISLLEQGEITNFTVHPSELDLPVYPNEQIRGGDAKENAEILLNVLNGKPGAYYNTVLLRSEEHTSELQSRGHLVCRLLLEKKNKNK